MHGWGLLGLMAPGSGSAGGLVRRERVGVRSSWCTRHSELGPGPDHPPAVLKVRVKNKGKPTSSVRQKHDNMQGQAWNVDDAVWSGRVIQAQRAFDFAKAAAQHRTVTLPQNHGHLLGPGPAPVQCQ